MSLSGFTLLGAIYASLYPDRVRAMVLDSALDPALSTVELSQDQAKSFEGVLDELFTWCASSSSCPWRPGADPVIITEDQDIEGGEVLPGFMCRVALFFA